MNAALRDATRKYREPRRSVLLPNGQTRSVPALEAADDVIREMVKLADAPSTMPRAAEQLAAAIDLVRLCRLVPDEEALALADGAAVL